MPQDYHVTTNKKILGTQGAYMWQILAKFRCLFDFTNRFHTAAQKLGAPAYLWFTSGVTSSTWRQKELISEQCAQIMHFWCHVVIVKLAWNCVKVRDRQKSDVKFVKFEHSLFSWILRFKRAFRCQVGQQWQQDVFEKPRVHPRPNLILGCNFVMPWDSKWIRTL